LSHLPPTSTLFPYTTLFRSRQTSVYVSAIHYRHPTLAYLAHDFDQLHWLTGGTALVLPAGRPALYLFARSAPPPADWMTGWAPQDRKSTRLNSSHQIISYAV